MILQEDIIREREEGIRNIHSDIVAIRGLFQEVAWHVSEQGQVLTSPLFLWYSERYR